MALQPKSCGSINQQKRQPRPRGQIGTDFQFRPDCASHIRAVRQLALVASLYFVATFTPLRPLASMAFCTTPLCLASSTSVASAACASVERPFGSAAATRTIAKAPATTLAPGRASAAGYPTPESAPKTSALPERSSSAASAAMVGL